jgi:hypothetical protein
MAHRYKLRLISLGSPLSRTRVRQWGQGRPIDAKQWQLIVGVGRRLMEVRYGDTEQPDTLLTGSCVRTSSTLPGGADRGPAIAVRETAAAGDPLEVAKLHLHRYGPREGVCLLAPGPDFIDHSLDAGLDFGRRGQVALEGGLGTGGFARTICDDRPVVVTVREARDITRRVGRNCGCRKASDRVLRSAPV